MPVNETYVIKQQDRVCVSTLLDLVEAAVGYKRRTSLRKWTALRLARNVCAAEERESQAKRHCNVG